MPAQRDIVMPFVFESLPIRGAIIQLQSAWHRMLLGHDYGRPVLETLGHSACASALVFRCRCTDRRAEDVLRLLGEAETRDVLAEQGRVEVICEYCGRARRYDAIDLSQVFSDNVPPPSGSLH